jgi:hypothetical protein
MKKKLIFILILIITILITSIVFAQTIPLAKTGQTVSYRTGDDGYFENGSSSLPRFIDHGDGTVTDNLTGLMWMKDANTTEVMSWFDAIDFADNSTWGCNPECSSMLCYDDWRLPNMRELSSLIDYSVNGPALPPNHPFINVIVNNGASGTNRYWTSTTTMPSNGYTGYAWSVELYAGTTSQHNFKPNLLYVWVVR